MSYVRTGPRSDVYTFESKNHLETYVSHEISSYWQELVPDAFCVPYEAGEDIARLATVGYLTYLRRLGCQVPDYAISRLLDEVAEVFDHAGIPDTPWEVVFTATGTTLDEFETRDEAEEFLKTLPASEGTDNYEIVNYELVEELLNEGVEDVS